jgi:Tfp pilus assembly protein PilN
MIKINLLPIESFRQTASGQLSVTIFAFIVIALCISLYFFKGLVMDAKVESMQATRGGQQTKLEQLKKTSTEALQKTTTFTNQLIQVDSISELEERRRDQTRLFSSLANLVNHQASWLTSINHELGLLSMRGLATDMQVVAEFQEALQASPLLANVTLIRTTQDNSYPQVRLFSFELRADTIFPQAALMATGLPEASIPPIEKMIQEVSTAAPTLGETLKKTAKGPTTL